MDGAPAPETKVVAADPVETPTIRLVRPEDAVIAVYDRPLGHAGARMLDVRVKATHARFVSASASRATDTADKQLVAQPTDCGARFVIFSSANVNTIGSGELFEATFEPTGDGPVTLEILTDEPIMAPADAAEGLIVGDPITL